MSAKWIRSQRWDDEHLTGVLWPLKPVLRWFSYISTAVILLSFVAFYGVLASVPIGIIALLPTWLFYGLTALASVLAGGVLPAWLATRAMRARGVGLAPRFVVGALGVIALGAGAALGWHALAWPHLRWDPVRGTGVRFFAEFVDRYKAVQFRRLPGVEMSELEFYAWWPLSLALVLFVTNLVVATVRRIEFNFPRVGVLMVHTGIVTIALGSVYYAGHKQEGDVLLLAGGLDESGRPLPGRPETGFYDNTRVALWVTRPGAGQWEQRPLDGVPRYNDYNLGVVPGAPSPPEGVKDFGPIGVVAAGRPGPETIIDDDVRLRVVGYASYAVLRETWAPAGAALGAGKGQRVRVVEAAATQPMDDGTVATQTWRLAPDSPSQRTDSFDMLGLEYTIGMSEDRWASLGVDLPPATEHALVVEVPGAGGGKGFRAVYPVSRGTEVQVGDRGYTLRVTDLAPRPPFPLVTAGYKGATSSLAVVHVTPPAGDDGKPRGEFDRWVYSRFPEISQDLLEELNERGMPKRRDADPAIRVWYVDASLVQVNLDERPDGTVRAMVRFPGGPKATITEGIRVGQSFPIAPSLTMTVKEKIEHAVRVEVPWIVPDEQRDKQRIGNHQAAAVAVEVSWGAGEAAGKLVKWVPFSQYLGTTGAGGLDPRTFEIGGGGGGVGRAVQVAFGRVRHEFWPPMQISLHDFQMTPYPHSETPRDYRSEVLVGTRWGDTYKDEVRATSLNEPLLVRTPYVAPEGMPLPGRVIGRLMSVIAPNQYKFSQAGWDQAGWRESAAAVERGEAKRALARFTILGVGTNPGIYIIAAGAVLMSVGIPWAFYLKPWLVKRQSKRLREEHGRGRRADGAGSGGATANGRYDGTHAPAGGKAGTKP